MITLADQLGILFKDRIEGIKPLKGVHERELEILGRPDLTARIVACYFNHIINPDSLDYTGKPKNQYLFFEVWKYKGDQVEDCIGQEDFFLYPGNLLTDKDSVKTYIAENLPLFREDQRIQYIWKLMNRGILNPKFENPFSSQIARRLLTLE